MPTELAQARRPLAASNGSVRHVVPKAASAGRAVVVCGDEVRPQTLAALSALGYDAKSAADPFDAAARLAADEATAALVLSFAAMHPEELALIAAVKRRRPMVDVVVCDVDGRGASFAEAVRLGADALLADGQLHRITPPRPADPPIYRDKPSSEDALTPEELRALLHDG